MGRARSRPGRLIAAALLGGVAGLVGLGLALGQVGTGSLRAERWIAPGADRDRALVREPTECLDWPTDPGLRQSVAIGRAAFRDPLLLGGQAARSGVACESCHRAGRTNPDFHFPGVSGAPGTADVTSSLFSSHRGDGIDNPRAIPDLSVAKVRLKVPQDRRSGDLERFIDGLVTKEFDGREPPPAVLKGLADYVRALGPQACPAAASRPVSVSGMMQVAAQALESAQILAEQGDEAASQAMVRAARAQLFLVDERLTDPKLKARLKDFSQTALGEAKTVREIARARRDLDHSLAARVAQSD